MAEAALFLLAALSPATEGAAAGGGGAAAAGGDEALRGLLSAAEARFAAGSRGVARWSAALLAALPVEAAHKPGQ